MNPIAKALAMSMKKAETSGRMMKARAGAVQFRHCGHVGDRRPRLACVADETPRPGVNCTIRVRRLPHREVGEIGQLVCGIGERKRLSAWIEAIDRQRRPIRVMGQIEGRNNAQSLRFQGVRPFQEANRVVESVVGPMDQRGLQINV
jgi:hypothetical protein